MSKTASMRRINMIRIFFCLLIGCVAAHFLIEDVLLISRLADQRLPQTSTLFFDETSHQDDLALPVQAPESAAAPDVPAVFAAIFPRETQVKAPLLLPPKTV